MSSLWSEETLVFCHQLAGWVMSALCHGASGHHRPVHCTTLYWAWMALCHDTREHSLASVYTQSSAILHKSPPPCATEHGWIYPIGIKYHRPALFNIWELRIRPALGFENNCLFTANVQTHPKLRVYGSLTIQTVTSTNRTIVRLRFITVFTSSVITCNHLF